MAERDNDNLIEEYLRRAMGGEDRSRTMPPERQETPRVFGGNMEPPPPSIPRGGDGGRFDGGGNQPSRNRPVAKRSVSTFNLILMLIAGAVVSVLYIGNIIRVGELTNEIGKLQDAHQRNLNEQELLRAQINRMSSLDRIQKMAESELGLISPKQQPVWMSIDGVRVQEVEEAVAAIQTGRRSR